MTFAAAWAATFLINIAWGSIFPVLNVYIHDRGISLVLIGTLSTAGSVVFSLAGLAIGRLSDRIGNRRELITGMLLVGAVGWLAYLWARRYEHFLALGMLDMLLIGGYTVLIDALVTSVLPEGRRGSDFGRYRISGSLGWAAAGTLLGATTGTFGIESIFVIATAAHLAAAVAVRFMREPPKLAVGAVTDATAVAGGQPKTRYSLWRLLINTGLLWLMMADLVAVFGSQLAFPFMNIYLAERFEADAGALGVLSTIGVLAEIPAMLGLGHLSDRVGRGRVLAFGFVTITVFWLLLYLAPGMWLVYLARPLLGLSIVRYSVGVALISDRVPYEERATLLGMTNLTYGAGGLVAPSVGGLLAASVSIQNVFLIAFAVQALAALLYVATMGRGQPAASAAEAG